MGEYILLGKGVDELREDVVLNNCLCKFLGVVGDPAQCQSSTVLDRNSRVQQKWPYLLEHA